MPKRILVIDDEFATRRVVVFALKAIQVETVEAESGIDALRLATEQGFDLALVDINLPDIDGFSLIKQLRQTAGCRDIPMIVFTARNREDDEMRAYAIGAVEFLYKPFSTQQLREKVRQHLWPDTA